MSKRMSELFLASPSSFQRFLQTAQQKLEQQMIHGILITSCLLSLLPSFEDGVKPCGHFKASAVRSRISGRAVGKHQQDYAHKNLIVDLA